MMEVRERVRVLRSAMGWSQGELAGRTGHELDRTYVAKIENGDNKASSMKVRQALARGFGLSLGDFNAYLEGELSVEEVLARVSAAAESSEEVPSVQENKRVSATTSNLGIVAEEVRPVVRAPLEDGESPLEAALARAFTGEKHTLRDLDAVRSAVKNVPTMQATEEELAEAVRSWLDAAARLRRAGLSVSVESLLVAVTVGVKPNGSVTKKK